jgi:hypothetical protein
MKLSEDGSILAACSSESKIIIWSSEKTRVIGAI